MPALVVTLGPLLPLLGWPLLAPVQRAMLLLIAVVGGVTLRFAHRYLQGAAHLPRFERWFVATVAAATLVVLADDLVVMALAWTATSLALHHLLTVMPGRAAAEVAAHKKFLLSRLADVAILGGVALLAWEFGTTDRDAVLAAVDAAVRTTGAVTGRVELAGLLLAAGVILRSAQLPFHGWLIQVMEAPTPVSALLHAGVVNLGAFVLIALGPLFAHLVLAQSLLVVAGTLTATLASLTLLTQSNVKGALAWSTCAQMGFVLLECGLGAYDLALLHLLAHALYKAHAFLRSGSAVVRHGRGRAVPAVPSVTRRIAATAAAAPLVAGIASLAWGEALARPAMQVSALVLVLAVGAALAQAERQARRAALGLAVGMPLLYAVWHLLFAGLVPVIAATIVPTAILVAVPVAFIALALVQAQVTAAPASRLARALHPHAVAGFHLDERFTRLTFRIWPPAVGTTPIIARRAPEPTAATRAA